MHRATIAAFIAALVLVPAASFAAMSFQEDFSTTAATTCQADGARFGSWEVKYASYGCVKIDGSGADRSMVIQPMVATSADTTHAPLILGPSVSGDLDFTVRMKTESQLRKNTKPNAWEVGWVLWDYKDDTHFYSLVLKPNGWELGKEDPAYPGAQRFLTTGSSPSFPIGAWYNVRIIRAGNKITAYVNGSLLTTFTDTERPYSGGRIALYNEDAITRFDDVVIGSGSGVTPATPTTTVMATPQTSAPTTNNRSARRNRRYSLRKIVRTFAYSQR